MRSVPRMRVDVRFQETAVQSMCESKYYHRVGEADQISEKKSGRKTVQGEDEATYRRRMPVLAGCGECEPRRRPLILATTVGRLRALSLLLFLRNTYIHRQPTLFQETLRNTASADIIPMPLRIKIPKNVDERSQVSGDLLITHSC